MRRYVILIALFFVTYFISSAVSPDKVIGIWYTATKDSKIEIYKKGDKYFGKIIWVRDSVINGKPTTDINNPNTNLKNRPVKGLNILKEFVFDNDDDEWVDGKIYDPRSGSTYSCMMWFDSDNHNTLIIKGYVGISLMGKKVKWTRIKKDIT
jgi:uncharacterized protein (DUF2147 family)